MNLQLTIRYEQGTACFTIVVFLSSVRTDVYRQCTFLCKLCPTCFTSEGFLSSVSTNVDIHSTFLCKLGTAYYTFEWFLPSVSTNVTRQPNTLSKLCPTCFTSVGFFSCMSTNVGLHITFRCTHETTLFRMYKASVTVSVRMRLFVLELSACTEHILFSLIR